jgi:ABC-type transport system involved in cytochrome c biogenesis ATPase subunit
LNATTGIPKASLLSNFIKTPQLPRPNTNTALMRLTSLTGLQKAPCTKNQYVISTETRDFSWDSSKPVASKDLMKNNLANFGYLKWVQSVRGTGDAEDAKEPIDHFDLVEENSVLVAFGSGKGGVDALDGSGDVFFELVKDGELQHGADEKKEKGSCHVLVSGGVGAAVSVPENLKFAKDEVESVKSTEKAFVAAFTAKGNTVRVVYCLKAPNFIFSNMN